MCILNITLTVSICCCALYSFIIVASVVITSSICLCNLATSISASLQFTRTMSGMDVWWYFVTKVVLFASKDIMLPVHISISIAISISSWFICINTLCTSHIMASSFILSSTVTLPIVVIIIMLRKLLTYASLCKFTIYIVLGLSCDVLRCVFVINIIFASYLIIDTALVSIIFPTTSLIISSVTPLFFVSIRAAMTTMMLTMTLIMMIFSVRLFSFTIRVTLSIIR